MVELRVILVGRTGLDAALRLDPGLEIIRVRTPLEAIGELATPIDEESPSKAAVILAPDIQKVLLEAPDPQNPGQPPSTLSGTERVVEFIRSLKLIDPEVRVLGVRTSVAGVLPEMYDGLVDSAAPAGEIRASVRNARGLTARVPKPETPRTEPIAPQSPARESKKEQPKPASDEPSRAESIVEPKVVAPPGIQSTGFSHAVPAKGSVGVPESSIADAELVDLLLKGRDILAAAVLTIRARTGDSAIEFLSAENDAPPGPDAVPVASGETLHGHLVPGASLVGAQTTPPDVLLAHAAWLAAWLRLRDQQVQLRQAAFTDPLTGAWNRRYFERFVTSVIETARLKRWSVTVMVFDIDDFKKYNDEFGHDAGDDILRETVRLLRSVIRPTDRVCRIGGDEFAVIFHEPQGPRKPDSRHPQSVHDIAARFQQQIQSHKFPKLRDLASGALTISGGLATYPWDGATAGELVMRADQLALESKRAGKNAIRFGTGGE